MKLKRFASIAMAVLLLTSCVMLSGCEKVLDTLGLDFSWMLGGNQEDVQENIQGGGQEQSASWPEETAGSSQQIPSETEKKEVPQLVGLSYEEALRALNDANTAAGFIYAYSASVPEGFVISQRMEGDVCILEISKGPMEIPENTQKVVVTAASGSSYGELALFNWENGEWIQVFSCEATVGKNGISSNYGEGKKRTPAGEFKLGVALSAKNISNDGWPFYKVTSDTCIVDDSNSVYYNTIRSISNLPSGVSYDPVGKTLSKSSNVLIYIEHNGDGLSTEGVVAGKGSVITICGKTGTIKPTAGCVDISASNMNKLMSKLDYSRNPVISISAT